MQRILYPAFLLGVFVHTAPAGPPAAPAVQDVEKAYDILDDIGRYRTKSDAGGNVVYLDISEQDGATDAVLAALAHLPHLKELHAVYCPIEGHGLAHAARLEKLETLALYGTYVDGRALQHISKIKSLRHLDVRSIGVSPTGSPPDSRDLISDAGLELLATLPNLETLRVSGSFTDHGLQHLGVLTGVRLLEVASPNVTEAGIEWLQKVLPDAGIEW